MLEGRVAIVMGGGQGIGRGIARLFAREGASIVVAEVSEEHGRRVEAEVQSAGGNCLFLRTDVSVKADVFAAVQSAAETFGRLDIIVNGATKLPTALLMEDKADAMFTEQLAINVWGTWWGMQAALPLMRKNGGGSIINFGSLDAHNGAWTHADAAVTKGAVEAMTRAGAQDWARFNIRVNALAPIAASAAFQEMCLEWPGLHEKANAMIPLGRMGDPDEDIAPAALFLASDMARFVTGVTLPVDGGLNMPRGDTTPYHLLGNTVSQGR